MKRPWFCAWYCLLFLFACGTPPQEQETPEDTLWLSEAQEKTTATLSDMFRSATGRCLDNAGGSTSDGNKVQLWDCLTNNPNQTWTMQRGTVVAGNGKCLDLKNGNTSNGTPIQQWDCFQNTNQTFNYSSGRLVYSANTAKCVDVSGGNTANGTKVQLYDCNGTAAQQWAYTNGLFRSSLGNKCLDVPGGSTANGTQLQIWDCDSGTTNQQWTLKNMAAVNSNGKCLDVAGGFSANGTKVQLWGCNGSGAQKWTVTRSDIKALGKCLDVQNSSTVNGTQVQIWDCVSGTYGQDWYFSNDATAPVAPLVTKPSSVPGRCRIGGYCARTNEKSAHSGTDYMTTANNSVRAICDGKVLIARYYSQDLRNSFTILEHTNCAGYGTVVAYYGHIVNTVSQGAYVARGQQIGTVAEWGSNTHLHFGMDPLYKTTGWGYPDIGFTTEGYCAYDDTRRNAVLNTTTSGGSGGWIDTYSLGNAYNWWGSSVSVTACQ